MNNTETRIGFGGGCHWCTEAIFQTLEGVSNVEQGWIGSTGDHKSISEAVIVHFDESIISLDILIEIHLMTHKSSSDHSMRKKYRSAIYSFNPTQTSCANQILEKIQSRWDSRIITKVYPFNTFKPSHEQIQNYYRKNPAKPFCTKYIDPKIELLTKQFGQHIK